MLCPNLLITVLCLANSMQGGNSYFNEAEGRFVLAVLRGLLRSGDGDGDGELGPTAIGVVTPYNAQVWL